MEIKKESVLLGKIISWIFPVYLPVFYIDIVVSPWFVYYVRTSIVPKYSMYEATMLYACVPLCNLPVDLRFLFLCCNTLCTIIRFSVAIILNLVLRICLKKHNLENNFIYPIVFL